MHAQEDLSKMKHTFLRDISYCLAELECHVNKLVSDTYKAFQLNLFLVFRGLHFKGKG
jgi:hypothetical protein